MARRVGEFESMPLSQRQKSNWFVLLGVGFVVYYLFFKK